MTISENPELPNGDPAGTRRRSWPFLVVVVGLSVLAGWAGRRSQDSQATVRSASGAHGTESGPPVKLLSQGAVLYQVHCAKCHGHDGRGDPEAMARLHSPPRDFAERPWRFEMAADSIRRVIADGIPGTSMAAQRAALAGGDMDLLADYVLQMVQQLPVVERTLTPEQRQLAALGFEIERRPFPAPKLTIEDAGGNSRALTDFAGAWVILEFWGAHCEPCRRAMPALQRLSISGIGEHVQVLPVCVDADDAAAAQDILTQIAPKLTAYVDSTGIGVSQFDIQALPATWLVDPEGHVRARHVGYFDWDSGALREAFKTMLAFSGFMNPLWTVSKCVGAPSHALYDAETNSLFVSQISGAGDDKDGVGVISRIDLDGNMLECEWVRGLDAPKGMARYGKTLWVSDIDRLHQIDIASGKITNCIDIPGAKFLTGVAVDLEGTVYIADMLTSTIHQYRDGQTSVFAAGDDLESPCGLVVDGGRLIVAAWGLTTDYSTRTPGRYLALEGRTSRPLSEPVGNLCGIVADGQRGWIGADFATGRVLLIAENAEPRILLRLPPGTAGVEFVPSRKLLIVPELTENRISAYDLTAVLNLDAR